MSTSNIKTRLIWLIAIIALMSLPGIIAVNTQLSSEEKQELHDKMITSPISDISTDLSSPEMPQMIVTLLIFACIAGATLYSYLSMGSTYKRIADRFTDYDSNNYTHIDREPRYEAWKKRNLSHPLRQFIPVIAACIILQLWIIFTPSPDNAIDAITPSVDTQGWIITTLAGLIIPAIVITQFFLLYRYWTYNDLDEAWQPYTIVAIVIIVNIQLLFIIAQAYTAWIILLAGAILPAIIFAAWPQSTYDEWLITNKAKDREIRAKEALLTSITPDYGSGSSSSASASDPLGVRRREEERRQRRQERERRAAEERRRRKERELEYATMYDCAYYNHGLGKEGCSFGGLHGSVTDSCQYEMSPGSCPHFCKR